MTRGLEINWGTRFGYVPCPVEGGGERTLQTCTTCRHRAAALFGFEDIAAKISAVCLTGFGERRVATHIRCDYEKPRVTCGTCGGSGEWVEETPRTCQKCSGTGKVEEE